MWYQFQRLAALLILVILSPVLAMLCLAVVLTSKGPFLYSQIRPGRGGVPMRIWKIRTMTPGADRNKSLARGVTSGCKEVTAIGRILRQLKLDELPQLWNIIRGEMSFVGPRPIAYPLYEELCLRIPEFEKRNLVRPGLSNVAQVSIEENSNGEDVIHDWFERFQAELHYINNQSVAYDLVVIVLTLLYVFRKALKLTIQLPSRSKKQSPINASTFASHRQTQLLRK